MSRTARGLAVVLVAICWFFAVLAPAAHSDPPRGDSRRGDAPRSDGPHKDARRDNIPTRASRTLSRVPQQLVQAPQPSGVNIESMSPRLRLGAPVRMSGTVFNHGDESWGEVQVGLVVRETPYTTTEDIAEAKQTPPLETTDLNKILTIGHFDELGRVEPGESHNYSFQVPYRQLRREIAEEFDGVYQIGVEVRAFLEDGRRDVVDRELTLIPKFSEPGSLNQVDLAMLWPVTAAVPWIGGNFQDQSLAEMFANDGRLRRLTDLAADSGDVPVTWVVDPAVLDAADAMSDGFGVRGPGDDVSEDSPLAADATSWLDDTLSRLQADNVYALPYGHPDLSALANHQVGPILAPARRATQRILEEYELTATRAAWPAAGRVNQPTLDATSAIDARVALVSEASLSRPPERAAVSLPSQQPGLQGLVLDPVRSQAGLRPTAGQSVIQWRQQLLAVTALMASDSDGAHAALAMPTSRWWPDTGNAPFFQGLRAPWLDPVSASTLLAQNTPAYDAGFHYPRSVRRREPPQANIALLRRLTRTTRTVTTMLEDPASNLERTDRWAGIAASTAWRQAPAVGRDLTRRAINRNQRMIEGVAIEAPEFVTLSGRSGRFPVAIVNQLDEPITIGLEVKPEDPALRIEDIDHVTIQPNQRVNVTVVTNAEGVGLTEVTVRTLTQRGVRFGAPEEFQVRTSQIDAVVWIIIGAGAGVLFIAAIRRIVRRMRAHRASRSTGEGSR